jgi:hypothetical protein
MGFHLEEEAVLGGTIDNRVKGKTVIRLDLTSHQSSLITLQGNPCRDLAGSLWEFRNPHGRLAEEPGEPCFFIPTICEGRVGRISYTTRREVPVLPPAEHYDLLFDEKRDDPPTQVKPVLELEWFSQKFRQVEIDCEQMTLELREMVWVMTDEEAKEGEQALADTREEFLSGGEEDLWEEIELVEDYVAEDVEPHELEEVCFLIVQEFVLRSSEATPEKEALHGELLKLQEQMSLAFMHWDGEGGFDDEEETVRLLRTLLPFIDRARNQAKFVAETTVEMLEQLRIGVVRLRNDLRR